MSSGQCLRLFFLGFTQSFNPVERCRDEETTGLAQVQGQEIDDVALVLDDENSVVGSLNGMAHNCNRMRDQPAGKCKRQSGDFRKKSFTKEP